MKSSILGTSEVTSLSIVLYWDSRRVHAGEYLYKLSTRCSPINDNDALSSGDRITNVGSLEVVKSDDDAEKGCQGVIFLPLLVGAVKPHFLV